MPLTGLQSDILAVIALHRTPENYIAGGTFLHFEPNSTRYSRDLDIFHDALEAVANVLGVRQFQRFGNLLRDADGFDFVMGKCGADHYFLDFRGTPRCDDFRPTATV